jgi:hypothetical protein
LHLLGQLNTFPAYLGDERVERHAAADRDRRRLRPHPDGRHRRLLRRGQAIWLEGSVATGRGAAGEEAEEGHLGFGRIVASEKEVPNMLTNLV